MITGTLSSTDYLNAQKLHRAERVRGFYLAVSVLFLAGIGVYFFLDKKLGMILAGSGLGGGIGEWLVYITYMPWKMRRLHRQQKDFASPFTYRWDTIFLEGRGISGQSKRPWANYAKYKEDDKVFLLYHADNLFEAFPKRWFQSEAQVGEFRELARRAGKS